jgi:hypothetical protein
MKSIFDIKRNLEAFRKKLVAEIETIDNILGMVDGIDTKRLCPKCNGRDVRVLKNNNICCRSCGYDSRPDNYASFLEDEE